MKNLIVIILIMAMFSCKSDKVLDSLNIDKDGTTKITNAGFFKKWKLISYENRKALSYNVIMELKPEKNERGFYILNGKSTINFYYAGFDFQEESKSFIINDISVTEIAGGKAEQEFETDYLNRLAKVGKYEISNDNKSFTLITSDTTPKKLYFTVAE
ncbi:MAG: META domain-containing protein [Bacteroidetes bacterium]|nr:META domain-containing protein [Bacteroidota bacterium]